MLQNAINSITLYVEIIIEIVYYIVGIIFLVIHLLKNLAVAVLSGC